jgi:hypothetical protein
LKKDELVETRRDVGGCLFSCRGEEGEIGEGRGGEGRVDDRVIY